MKKNSIWMWIIMVSVLLAACGAPAAASSMDAIRQSAVARLEEPDGKTA